ncbi:unnamed protein product [Caenorhabditis angaria]|uniref:Uncharacterized protein n=1 Tax=Caenorhabditis angaria TaxID=860376 RepID=A0A9P1N2D4_9PELO|nr:unnamed protein product [Caenorhabditis angaria]
MRTILIIFQFFGFAYNQMMGYPFDYSSMFQGYNAYNPLSAYSGMGMGLYGNSFGQNGFESLYGNSMYGNGMFNGMYNSFGGAANTMNNGLFGTSFGNQQNFAANNNNNMFGGNQIGMGMGNGVMQGVTTNNGVHQGGSSLNNGNTMRSYGRRTQNYNYAAPTRQVNTPSGCGSFGCQNGGWKAASKS